MHEAIFDLLPEEQTQVSGNPESPFLILTVCIQSSVGVCASASLAQLLI